MKQRHADEDQRQGTQQQVVARMVARPDDEDVRTSAGIRKLRPDAAAELAEALGHSMVVLGELDAASARQVDQILANAGVFNATAGHVVHVARQRGWPALSADPGRLRRVRADIEIDLL